MAEPTEEQRKEFELYENALGTCATLIPLVAALHENEPRKTVLLALLQATARECQRLKVGLIASDQALLAWACRNLLELSIFVKYVLQSEANGLTFQKDSIVDLHEMMRVVQKWQKREQPERDEEVAQAMKVADAFKELAGITTDDYLRASVLAKTVAKAAEYETIHKICSKYVHPTAFSILAAYEAGVLNALNLQFFQRGTLFNAEICNDIALYVAAKSQPT
jgi:hypothetical protein